MTQFSEVIKFKNRAYYNLPYHQARIDSTLRKFEGDKIDLIQFLSEVSAPKELGLFKCRIVYSKDVESIEFTPYTLRNITTVGIVINNAIDYGYKYTDRNLLNKLLKESNCDDIIIVKQGCVTDASSSNLIFESDEGLFTPDTCLLPGTKRKFLIDTKIVSERRITLNDIRSYDRIRFINAMVDLEDNVYIDVNKIDNVSCKIY